MSHQNTPALRFKDREGKEFPEWEEKNFGEALSFQGTNSFSRSQLNYEAGEVKNIHYGDIHTKFKTLFDITQENVPFVNEDINLRNLKEESYCREGDLILADASEDYNDVGKAIEIVNLNDEKVVSGLHTLLARDKAQTAIGFKGYLMQSRAMRLQMMKMATGISVLSVSKGNLGKMKLVFPCLEEQQKIASFLSAIDDKIENLEAQLGQRKTFKKV